MDPNATKAVPIVTRLRAQVSRYWHAVLRRLHMVPRYDFDAHVDGLRAEIRSARGYAAALREEVAALQQELLAYQLSVGTTQEAFSRQVVELKAHFQAYLAEYKQFCASYEDARGQVRDIMFALEKVQAEIRQTDWTLRIDFARELLRQRHALARFSDVRAGGPRLFAAPTEAEDKLCPVEQAYQAGLERLRRLCPQAYAVWYPLLDVNSLAYDGLPTHSCSVAGHDIGEHFGYFVQPYLTGRVLDIGCGPQPLPNYLANYPPALISGIDPLEPVAPHPFDFVRGVAEYLPWRDGTFSAVIAATSLDHVLVPDLAFQEIVRVLAPGGTFLTWVAFVRGAAPYDPFDPNIKPIDAYHLFHFSQEFFEGIVSKRFQIVERISYDGESYFYCLRRKVNLAQAA